MNDLRQVARDIFQHALAEASIAKGFARHVHCERGILRVCEDLYDLHSYSRVLVISLGKAGHTMVEALSAQVGASVEGIVASSVEPATQVHGFRYFRGTGLSQGEHDNGIGEVDDVRAALDWVEREYHLPIIFAGFSFGAAVGLRASCSDDRVRAVIGVGTPVGPVVAGSEVPRNYTFEFLQQCSKPKLFVSGSRDQFGPRAELEALLASASEPKKLVIIEAADHFFEGRLRELRDAVEAWVREQVVS